MATGLAAKLRVELAELARKHGVPAATPVILPPTAPPLGDLIVCGLATTRAVPLDRIAIRPWAIPILQRDNPPIKLLFKHDTPAGVIEHIEHDELGQLRIRARVTCPYAKSAGGLSISTRVLRYELRDVDSKNFYAIVLEGELDEISLTHSPADPAALIAKRYQPVGDSLAKAIVGVERLKVMLAALPPHLFAASAPKRALEIRELTAADRARLDAIHRRTAARFHAANPPFRPRGSFSELAHELNSRMA